MYRLSVSYIILNNICKSSRMPTFYCSVIENFGDKKPHLSSWKQKTRSNVLNRLKSSQHSAKASKSKLESSVLYIFTSMKRLNPSLVSMSNVNALARCELTLNHSTFMNKDKDFRGVPMHVKCTIFDSNLKYLFAKLNWATLFKTNHMHYLFLCCCFFGLLCINYSCTLSKNNRTLA